MKKLALLFVLAMFWLTATSQSVKIDSVGGIIPGSSVTANISLYDFAPDNICAFQFTINYDSTKLTFISISDWYSGFVGVAVYNYWNALTNSMVITVNWGCDSYGTVIPNGGILCKLNFTYKATASGCTPIEWADSPTPRLIANDQYFIYNSVEYVNGELCSCTSVAILTQPGNQSICNTSGSADLSTTASGYSPITYQWQYYNGSTWTNVVDGIPTGADYSNETSPTMTVAGITTAGNFQYRCYLTNCSGTNNASTDPATITVIPNNTITLTAGGTQTKCINTPITTTTYTTSGATGATISGLPAGVTGSWASNTVTISGTPTVSGAFTYTVTLSGGCGAVTATGTITVTPNNTITLTAGGTQTKCINTPITTTTYTTSGATGATISGLPAGVIGSWASNTVTISGTPTVSGTFTYTVTLSGGCGTVTATGTMTVTPNNTITLTAGGTQTKCINTPITTTTYATSGATGATISGLPAGVIGSWASNTVTISGTPTVSGAFTYTVTLSGGCGAVTATGTITVTPNNTITLTAGGTQTKCINTPITTTTYATSGATGATISGLPAGVTGSWSSNTVTISGTPTVSGAFTYTVTLSGGCGTVTATGTITVTPNNTIVLTSAAGSNAQTKCINTAITTITYATTGATGAAITGLPAGVTGSWSSNTVTISGTPTVSGAFTYTVTLSGGCGTVTATGTLTVTPNNTIVLTSAAGTNAQTKCINTAITNITYGTTGATGAVITGLPAGVTGSWSSNTVTISGTPTVSGAFTYTVTLSGGCGTVTATGTITVTPNNTMVLTSAAGSNAQTKCINTAITTITYGTTGATGAAITGLPAGVTGSWASNTVTISGTPTVSGTFTYTVTLSGGCGTVTATGTLTVTPNNTIVLTSAAGTNAQTKCINTAITTITYGTTGATGAAITGLPAGVTGSWASNTVTISGTPTVSGAFTYTVTLSGGCGTVTATGTLTVTPNNTIVLTSAAGSNAQTKCINTAITTITYGTTGATGAAITGLPAGVTGSWSSNTVTISGTPTVSGTFTYTVTLSGGCGTVTATGTLTVTPNNTIVLTSAAGSNAQTKCINTAITTITYGTTGATGAAITGLPAGVTGSWSSNTVTISGTPTVSGTFTYTVTLSGGCGTVTATGTITVTPNNAMVLTSAAGSNAQTKCINTAITTITYATTGATGAAITGLPAGVTGSWSSNTVTISGTPTVSGAFTYTVTLTGGCGNVTTVGAINVVTDNTIVLTSALGTDAQTSCLNISINNITYATGGASGAVIAGLPAGVTGSWASDVVTISGTPTVTGTFTYTITLTGGCGTVATTGTLTVMPTNTIVLTGGGSQIRCFGLPILNTTYATTGATGANITGLPAGVTGSWASNVVTINGTPSVTGTFTYTVSLTGGCGNVSQTGSLLIRPDNTITLTAGGTQTSCVNTVITTTTYTTTGATGAVVSGLPAGVSGGWTSNAVTISGTPTVTGVFTYTVTLTGGCGNITSTGTLTIEPDNTISLTSAAGTNAQTLCVNTAIANISYVTTGATGAAFTGLPSGVTGTWAMNQVTISGTPTVAGTYSYSVSLTGGCSTVYATGIITVTPDNIITLTSAAGTDSQTKCVNAAINNITYSTSGATGATITGLPAGVTGSWSSNTVTISGTPTVSGAFTYTVTLTGGCENITSVGTINVVTDNTIVLTSALGTDAQTSCLNISINNITYATGGASGAVIAGLPAGVTGSWASDVVTISGTPTVTGTFTYTITLTGGCGTVATTGTLTVMPTNTIVLTGGGSQIRCFGLPILNTTYATTGATGANITGLPAGVTGSWASNVVTINGTPSVTGTFTYTVSLTGGCGNVSQTGSLLIRPDNTITLTAGGTQTSCVNTVITTTTYTTTGATGAVVSGLPAGVSGGWTSNAVTISGTPTVTGVFTYTVTLTGGCGNITSTGTLTIEPDNTISLTSAAGTNAQTLCVNTAITNISYVTTGATGAAFTGLPAGVTGVWSSDVVNISGTPTVTGDYSYTITLTGGCGNISTSGDINVTPDNTITLTSGGTQVVCINTPLANTTYSTTGATGAVFSGLPSGVSGSWNSNIVTISGTPTVSGTFNYSVGLLGGCGADGATGTITVTSNVALTLSSGGTQDVCINTPITTTVYTTTGATAATVSGLPSGVTALWESNSITISGTPTVSGTYNYSVTVSGGCGNSSDQGTLTVIPDNTVTLTAGGTQSICLNNPIITTTYTTSGATGVTITGLPAGVTGTWASDMVTISGIPTLTGTFIYTVELSGGCGILSTTGTITVGNISTLALSSAPGTDGQVICFNSAITDITYAATNATGATVNGLPAGVLSTWSSGIITISGTPTVSGSYSYTVTVTGACGITTTNGSIIVEPNYPVSISIQASENPTCTNTMVDFTANAVNSGGAPLYQWYLNTVPISGGTASTYSSATLNNGDMLQCLVVSNLECAINNPTMSDPIIMSMNTPPYAEAGNTAIYSGTPVQIGDPANGPGNISWAPASGLDNPAAPLVLATPATTTTYTLTIDNNACVRTDTVTVKTAMYKISGKTRYLGKAFAGLTVPYLPTYNPSVYTINQVIVRLMSYPAGIEIARDTSNEMGVFEFTGLVDGNYILSYKKYTWDSMQYVNEVNAIDVALLKYLVGHDTVYDPSRNFKVKYKKAANVDNNLTINAVDVGRVKAKVGQPYIPAANYPGGNWTVLDTLVTLAGADLNIILKTVAYGDYDASSSGYKDSAYLWSTAKYVLDENIIAVSDESVNTYNSGYFEVPLRISHKMNEFSALGLELNYPSENFRLVSATMPKTSNKSTSVKINPSYEEIIADDNDLLVTDIDGVIRVVFATTSHFDVTAGDEVIRLGFRILDKPVQGELNFGLAGTGVIADQYGRENPGTYLSMPKVFVQGVASDAGFTFSGYPNPFNTEANLMYNLPESGLVKLAVYNSIGALVSVLVDEKQQAGNHTVEFSDNNLSSGMYTFKLEYTGSDVSKTMILKLLR